MLFRAFLSASATLVALVTISAAYAYGEAEHEAAREGDTETLKALIESGVDVNSKDPTGNTPLHWASNSETAELLISLGADIDARDEYGHTPLHDADNADVADTLVAHGADVNAVDSGGDTPLHWAIIRSSWPSTSERPWKTKELLIIERLLIHGANINAKGQGGQTPLHHAESVEVARVLIDHGADVNARDHQGLKPWDIVRRSWANRKLPETEALLTLLADQGGIGLRPVRVIVFPVLASGLVASLLLMGFLRLKNK